jgi:hypothetical protein
MSPPQGGQSADVAVRLDLGPSLLQLIVSQIDSKATSKPADVIATLAFFAGRIVQRAAFHEQPASFRLDQSDNGVSFLRSDAVTDKLFAIKSGTLASKLVESSLMCGANRFPNFLTIRQNAHEMMQRRAGYSAPENLMSDTPDRLAAEIQTDIDSLLMLADDRQDLIVGIFDACALAIGYARHKLAPVLAAELAMSVALYAGWLDQRKIGAR